MLLANRRAQYKYSKSGMNMRHESETITQNNRSIRITFFKKAVKVGLVLAVIGFVVIFYINQFARISSSNYEIQRLEKELTELNRENQKIRVSISEKKSLKHIEEEARRLGLVDPAEVYYISDDPAVPPVKKPAPKVEKEKSFARVANEVGAWLKNLTSVEAGTLDE